MSPKIRSESSNDLFMHPRKSLSVTGLLLGLALSQASAADFLMANRNATAEINITNANAGIASWTIDGVNQLAKQGFYFRVGSGPEALVQSISSSPTVTFTQVPNVFSSLDVTYASASYSVRTLFQLTGGTAGSGTAGLNETITINNLTSSPLDFHFFQFSDFNLGGVSGGQSAQFQFDTFGQPYKVSQTDGTRTITETVNANTAPIGHFQAALGGTILASLTDGSPTVLTDVGSAGPGDATFAYQWDVVLQGNQTLTISKLMSIVPEPTTGSLILVAAAVSATLRRKKGF